MGSNILIIALTLLPIVLIFLVITWKVDGGEEKRDAKSVALFFASSFGIVAVLGGIDYITGYEISLSIFYLLPIIFLTWFVSIPAGILMSYVSSIVSLSTDVLAGRSFSHPLVEYWATAVTLLFFLIITYLTGRLRNELAHAQMLAGTDFLTNVKNRRSFTEFADREIQRSRRYRSPISIAFLDIDHFKRINDKLGHSNGDLILRAVADTIKRNLRASDAVGRLGGDEFAVLLPEIESSAVEAVLKKLRTVLAECMREQGWPVTFSIGAVTYAHPPNTFDEMMADVDKLMYSVKDRGKDDLNHIIMDSRVEAVQPQ